MPSTIPMSRALSGSGSGISGAADSAVDPFPASSERLSRSGSTAVMSVSEFYGPSGARMLQRRSSTASQLSLADSYGEGEALESASATKENREGQAALSILMAAGAESEQQSQQQQQQQPNQQVPQDAGPAAAVGGAGATVSAEPAAPSAAAAGTTRNAWAALTWPPGQQQALGAVDAAVTAALGGEAPGLGPSAAAVAPLAATAAAPSAVGAPGPAATGDATGTAAAACVHLAEPGVVGVVAEAAPPVPPPVAAAAASQQSLGLETPATAVGVPPVSALPVAAAAGTAADTAAVAAATAAGRSSTTQDAHSPPPLALDAPHPCASAGNGGGGGTASSASAVSPTQPPPPAGQSRPCDVSPASSLSLPPISAATGVADAAAVAAAATAQLPPLEQEPMPEDARNQRAGHLRAMSVDSAPSPAKRPHARTLSFAGGGPECHAASGLGGLRSTSSSDMLGLTVNVPGGSGSGGGGGATPHSPRLRAKSMDSKGRKGKSKRGKGPGSAVMGKADRIGRMLQVSQLV